VEKTEVTIHPAKKNRKTQKRRMQRKIAEHRLRIKMLSLDTPEWFDRERATRYSINRIEAIVSAVTAWRLALPKDTNAIGTVCGKRPQAESANINPRVVLEGT
jgi:hypothetical protein